MNANSPYLAAEDAAVAKRDDRAREAAHFTQSEAGSLMEAIKHAATDPNIDVAKIKALYELHEMAQQAAAKRAFKAAMAAAQAEMQPVIRDAKNDQTHSLYARLETISEMIQPIITKHGFSTQYSMGASDRDGYLRVVCTVAHEAGHEKDLHLDLPADMAGARGNVNKTEIHGIGSTISYGRRYLKLMAFDIQVKGMDDDGKAASAGPTISEDQVATLQALIDEVGADKAKFLEYGGVSSLGEIAAKDYAVAVRILEQKRRQ